MHHSGGTVCEPVDLPVNKRHLDMVHAHIRYSDKPFMGSVTHPLRALDTIEMAKIVFGADFKSEEHTSELQSLMRISYAVFCLKKKKNQITTKQNNIQEN